jgi:hypothetical protein
MTYQPHVRLTFSGTLGGGSPAPEIFSFGLSIDRASDLSQTQNDNVAAAAVALFQNVAWHTNSWAVLKQVKSKAILASGHYAPGAPIITTVNQAASGSGVNHPPQVAMCVSLLSYARGPRGRFYLPAPSDSVDATTLELNSGQQSSYLAAVTTFLDAVNTAAGGGPGNANGLCIASGKGAGENAIVTTYRLGRALDTMRSRRRSLNENYLDHAV